MRAVIYLVSGVLFSVLLLPAPLLERLPAAEVQGRLAPTEPSAPDTDTLPQEQADATRQAFARGTNNVATDTLLRAGLAPDALEKGADLDADGDPDVLHIRLEAVPARPWTLQPKAFGRLPTRTAASLDVPGQARLPDIHLETGDRVLLTLENTHSRPLNLRFAGGALLALTPAGLPVSQAVAVLPGASRTWLLHPLREGETDYTGLALEGSAPEGRVLVTANLPDNTLQTLDTAPPAPANAPAEEQDTPAPADMTAGQLLQLSGFGLALGLALAGLLGLLQPLVSVRRPREVSP